MLKRVLGHLARRMGIQRRVNWYLRKINYIKKVYINDVEVRIPSIHGIACDASEPWMIDLLTKMFQERSGAFLDVGVNVGQTLVKVKALDPHREYIGFEPNPTCVSYVQNLINANAFKNCTLLPVGLFTKDCVLSLDFFSDDVTDSSASLINNFRPDHRIHSRVFVPVFQFNSLAKILGEKSVGIVKIDVEGAELEVVKSLLELIRRDKPIILIELLPVYSNENTFRKNRQDELERIFADTDYVILRVEKTPSNTYSGLKRVDKIGIHSDLTQCDYVVLPSAQLAELQMMSDTPANKALNPTGVERSGTPAG
jgi:FkbM family methyltransferase